MASKTACEGSFTGPTICDGTIVGIGLTTKVSIALRGPHQTEPRSTFVEMMSKGVMSHHLATSNLVSQRSTTLTRLSLNACRANRKCEASVLTDRTGGCG